MRTRATRSSRFATATTLGLFVLALACATEPELGLEGYLSGDWTGWTTGGRGTRVSFTVDRGVLRSLTMGPEPPMGFTWVCGAAPAVTVVLNEPIRRDSFALNLTSPAFNAAIVGAFEQDDGILEASMQVTLSGPACSFDVVTTPTFFVPARHVDR